MQGESATGHFDWRVVEASGRPDLVGREAREYFIGTHIAGTLMLQGTHIDDPAMGGCRAQRKKEIACFARGPALLAVDHYRLRVGVDRVEGESRTHEQDWSGQLTGELVDCRTPEPAGNSTTQARVGATQANTGW